LGHALIVRRLTNDTNASFRTESQSFLTGTRLQLKGRGARRSTERSSDLAAEAPLGAPPRDNNAAYGRNVQLAVIRRPSSTQAPRMVVAGGAPQFLRRVDAIRLVARR
jgi:hypothetical protein